jgi:hypothetical protein
MSSPPLSPSSSSFLKIPSLRQKLSIRTLRREKDKGEAAPRSPIAQALVASAKVAHSASDSLTTAMPEPGPFGFGPAEARSASNIKELRKDVFVRDSHSFVPPGSNMLNISSFPGGMFVDGKHKTRDTYLYPGQLVQYGKEPLFYCYTGRELRPEVVTVGNEIHESLREPSRIEYDTLIGRQNKALRGLDLQVSNKHARLTYNGTLRDLNSTNGTYVNGKKIDKPTQLNDGDEVQLGVLLSAEGNPEPELDRVRYHNDPAGRELVPFYSSVHPQQIQLHPHGKLVVTPHEPPLITNVNGHRVKESKELKDGDIVRLGKNGRINYYYDDGRLLPLTKKQADFLLHVIPEGLGDWHFKQGNLGSCNILAPIAALIMHNPAKYINMFALKDGVETVIFNFPGATAPVEVKLKGDYAPNGVNGIPMVCMLEVALARAKKPLQRQSTTSTIATLKILDKGDDPKVALQLLTGVVPTQVYTLDNDKSFSEVNNASKLMPDVLQLLESVQLDPKHCIATAGTRKGSLPNTKLVGNHAYAIKGDTVDMVKKRLMVTNPWDTKNKDVPLTFKEFFENFTNIEMAELT